ncbi:MAG: biosynthetic-type acetolactate synthase large subunit [Bacteriovoracaceae bacterium]|nr:biosynthetic-type acetolactate synthase large subunit [Bacteriovoracaceae bacterium]
MTNKLSGAQILIECLKAENVTDIFGYPGGAVLEIYDAIYNSDINHYLVRHEQAAAHAADGYARSTGKVGVCIVTSGPGATNVVTGIATANIDSIPMIIISGQVGTTSIGKDAFQEADLTGITMPISKHNYLVKDIKILAKVIKEAFHIARSGRPGPVLIDLPKDVAMEKTEYKPITTIDIPTYKPTIKGNAKQVKAVISFIERSKRPVLFVGGGVVIADAHKELMSFVEKTSLPVIPTLMSLGVFPFDHPLCLRFSGMHGLAHANMAIFEADLIIAIGMRFDDRITGKITEFAKNAQVVHIDIDPAEIGKSIPVDLPVVGDAKAVLKDLNSLLKKNLPKKEQWLSRIQELKAKYPLAYEKNTKAIKPQAVVETIAELADEQAIIATDVGEHQMWAAQYLHHRRPRKFLSSGGMGTMGYGVPAAVGAQVANPDKQVITISGDGSFQMNLQELSTISFCKLPIKIIIFNNRFLGMVRQWQDLFYEKRYSEVDLEGKQPDFVKLADAYGILGLRIDNVDDLKPILKQGLDHAGPVLIDVRIEREENVYPMVPAGRVLNQMKYTDKDAE